MTAAFDAPGRSVHIQLQPETLGGLTVRVSADDRSVRLHITAEQSATRDLIDASVPQLTQTLESKNISIDRLIVDIAASGASVTSSGQQDQPSRSSSGMPARSARPRPVSASPLRVGEGPPASIHQIDYRV
jgi:flagellar hook-length control protein FliK